MHWCLFCGVVITAAVKAFASFRFFLVKTPQPAYPNWNAVAVPSKQRRHQGLICMQIYMWRIADGACSECDFK